MKDTGKHAYQLMISGLLLFLLGLINGAFVQHFMNPRMGLSAHLSAVQNGLVLIVFGLIWPKADFSKKWSWVHCWSSVLSLFGIWIALVLAALWGTSGSTPIAGKGFQAEVWREATVGFLLISSSILIVLSTNHLLWRLFRNYKRENSLSTTGNDL